MRVEAGDTYPLPSRCRSPLQAEGVCGQLVTHGSDAKEAGNRSHGDDVVNEGMRISQGSESAKMYTSIATGGENL